MLICVRFVSSASDIVFNPSADEMTDCSQSAKDTEPYFKSQLCGGPQEPKVGPNGPNGPSQPGASAWQKKLISAMGRIWTNKFLIDWPIFVSPTTTATTMFVVLSVIGVDVQTISTWCVKYQLHHTFEWYRLNDTCGENKNKRRFSLEVYLFCLQTTLPRLIIVNRNVAAPFGLLIRRHLPIFWGF